MNAAPTIDKYAARLLMVSFFLPGQWEVWITMATCAYFLARTLMQKQAPRLADVKWALALGALYVAFVVAVPFTPAAYKPVVYKLLELRATLLVMPVIFSLLSPRCRQVIRQQVHWFAAGCVVAGAVVNAIVAYHYWVLKDMVRMNHEEYRLAYEAYSEIHPTYMGMYLCFAICVLLTLPAAAGNGIRVLRMLTGCLALVFLLALLPKTAVLVTVGVLVHYAFTHRAQLLKLKWMLLAAFGAVLFAAVKIPFVSQRVGEILSVMGKGKATSAVNNSVHVRKLILQVNGDLVHRYWLLGAGPGRFVHLLKQRYFFYSLSHGFAVGYYDPHNEYVAEWLSFGLPGLALLLFLLAAHSVRAIKQKDRLYIYLVALIIPSLFTETVLVRQHGVMFFTIFASLFFFYGSNDITAIRE